MRGHKKTPNRKNPRRTGRKKPAQLLKKGSILELRGLGKEIRSGVDPDEYVRRLRK